MIAERGATIIISAGGDVRGKPRPAVVVQAHGVDFRDTVLIVPLTSEDADAHPHPGIPSITPDQQNGLEAKSRAMIHRIGAVRKARVGKIIGKLSMDDMTRIDAALMFVLGLGTS